MSLSNNSEKKNLLPKTKILLQIDSLGSSGEGVGRHEGLTIFVDGALPGELVWIEIETCKKSYAMAKLLKIEKKSPHRVDPICPLFGLCGGCQLMHLDYASSCLIKQQKVKDAFERIGKLDPHIVQATHPSPKSIHYRNKIQLPIRPDGTLGLYKKGSHEIIAVNKCFIHCEIGEAVFKKIQRLLSDVEIPPYDFDTKKGNLRHILIKTSLSSKKALVVLVTEEKKSLKLLKFAELIMQNCPEVHGVIQNIHEGKENVILGRKFFTLAGNEKIFEEILGLTFSISAASFFQVNPKQAENLYKEALKLSEVGPSDVVLDAYCGVGTMSLLFAKHAKHVIGCEKVPQAIDDAKQNAKLNGIHNVEFLCEESENAIQKLKHVDICIINPPRKGCEKSFLQAVATLRPKRLIYVSCDPATLARDLNFLQEMGMRALSAHPFDMFPQTSHVETIVKLEPF